MRQINWDTVQEASDFPKPEPGGYIVQITAVKDEEYREYLLISYDFAEGELKGYYKDLAKAKGFWGGTFIRSYKEKALPFFKGFKTAVEESNRSYEFRNDPQSLVHKFVGVVLAEEEYKSNDGKIKTRLYVDQVRSIAAIQAGEYAVPPLKKYEPKDSGGFAPLPDSYPDGNPFADDDPFAGLADGFSDDDPF